MKPKQLSNCVQFLLCDIFFVLRMLNKKKNENNITSKSVEMAKITYVPKNLRITVTDYLELRIKTKLRL